LIYNNNNIVNITSIVNLSQLVYIKLCAERDLSKAHFNYLINCALIIIENAIVKVS